MAYKHTSIGFRFFAISPSELSALRALCAQVESRQSRSQEGRVTGVFDLHEGVDYKWVKKFVDDHQIAATDYGLFVSIATSSDSEIVSVPQFALDLFREVGGEIDFSFTVLSED